MKRRSIVLGFLLILLLTVTACSGGSNSPKNTKKDSLIVATAYDAKSLDPVAVNDVASTNVMRQIYEPLIEIDNNGNIIEGKGLAESVEQDGVKYTIHIKKNILFHNGEELKADDVAFSLDRASKAPIISHIFGDIDGSKLKVIDDYTVEVSLKSLNSTFLPSLAHSGGYIANRKAVEEAGSSYGTTTACGTGPFKFVSWTKSDKVVLERFEDFHGDAPAFKTMEIRNMPEPTSRSIALESGDVDVAYEIATIDIKKVEDNENLKMLRTISNTTQYLGFNTQKEPFSDQRVRKAISYVVDMPSIVKAVYQDVGQVATGPIGPNVKYSISSKLQPHEVNIEKAKALLKEAGLESGFNIMLSTNEKKERVDMATIIKEQLAQVNIAVEIEVLEWSKYLDKLSNGDVEMFEIGWSPAVPDPDMGLWAPLSTFTIGAGGNFSRYSNPKVDELLKQGRTLSDSPEREAIYKEIQEMVIEECPWIFQYNSEEVIGVQKNIENLNVAPFGYQSLFTVTFSE